MYTQPAPQPLEALYAGVEDDAGAWAGVEGQGDREGDRGRATYN